MPVVIIEIPYLSQAAITSLSFMLPPGWIMPAILACAAISILSVAGKNPSDSEILGACAKLTGKIEQIPPIFSAVHVNGKHAYELARQGEQIEMQPRPITIYELEFVDKKDEEYNFRVVCSRGTYVRSIVRDIAKICETVATTTYIKRTKTNGFDIKNAVKLDFLENLVNNSDAVMKYLMAPDCALGDIPVINLDKEEAKLYKNGGFIKTDAQDGFQRVYSDNKFIGIGYTENGLLHPKRTL